ncbi:hypothetical protein EGH56_23550 [Klebsiella aerogenes]|uniref:hypothetical protein n=1 Tax=Klebsiella aerogenes TaxID=548 RepID=UPI000F7EA94D|nr:hypothetical protein [Klebsiella aerogenes]RSV81131.1 hypothetical protein EGH56_23550 [Klebsiella aerogenes]HCB3607980.1 hypothetical protein [Klebsiella aerogenes]HDT4463346.1 hypothetical protein [Klebsiella aerogenes]HDU5280851.1 hypothetical protein [Klebsiella aerogenes]HEM8646780.1 hypothetical protein [Klebsiella aerogenes]
MDKTRDFILEGLSRFDLADLPGRPYDCAFDLLAATPSRKRLIMMGFNGSLADSCMTNRQSILQDYEHPFISGIQEGIQGKWGITHLAKRLQQIPSCLGYSWEDVIYTNALMMCSQNAATLKKEAARHEMTMNEIEANSMAFFEHVTAHLSEPDLIVAYSNSLQSLSAARLLLKHFGDATTLKFSQPKGYHTTFAFMANLNSRNIPVICVRHMSRFKPEESYIRAAVKLMGC